MIDVYERHEAAAIGYAASSGVNLGELIGFERYCGLVAHDEVGRARAFVLDRGTGRPRISEPLKRCIQCARHADVDIDDAAARNSMNETWSREHTADEAAALERRRSAARTRNRIDRRVACEFNVSMYAIVLELDVPDRRDAVNIGRFGQVERFDCVLVSAVRSYHDRARGQVNAGNG